MDTYLVKIERTVTETIAVNALTPNQANQQALEQVGSSSNGMLRVVSTEKIGETI